MTCSPRDQASVQPGEFEHSWPPPACRDLVMLVCGEDNTCIASNAAFDHLFGTHRRRRLDSLIQLIDGNDLYSLIDEARTTGVAVFTPARLVRLQDFEHGYVDVVSMDFACEPLTLNDAASPAVLIRAGIISMRPWGTLASDSSGAPSSALSPAASSSAAPSIANEMSLPIERDRVAHALQAGQIGVWEWDLRSGKSVWNSQMYRLIGTAPAGQHGTEEFLGLIHPHDRPSVEENISSSLQRRQEFVSDFRIIRADTGEERWLAGRGRVLCNRAGEPVAMTGVNFDITQEISSQVKLKAMVQRRAEFVAMLSHELRNPLAPLAYIARQLQASARAGSHEAMAAQVIKRQVDQLARLVEDLLEVSRIELDKIVLRPQVVAVQAVVDAAAEAVAASVRERDQLLTLSLPVALRIQADPARLSQVLANLVGNASKYTQPGGQISLEVQELTGQVRFLVTDNGPGIGADLASVLFEPFTQGRATLDRARDGLGVGLTIAKKLVELHQGSLAWATSQRGTCFTVTLPALAEAETVPRKVEGDLGSSFNPARRSRMRILVVEDNPDAGPLLAGLLREEGHDVWLAVDGQEGLAVAMAEPFEAVLLDIGLPKLDGWAVATALRAHDDYKNVALIAITGYGQPADRACSKIAGFDLHLTKSDDVINEVLTFLNTR